MEELTFRIFQSEEEVCEFFSKYRNPRIIRSITYRECSGYVVFYVK